MNSASVISDGSIKMAGTLLRHCLENNGRESDTLAGHFLFYMIIGARWLGHCVAGVE